MPVSRRFQKEVMVRGGAIGGGVALPGGDGSRGTGFSFRIGPGLMCHALPPPWESHNHQAEILC